MDYLIWLDLSICLKYTYYLPYIICIRVFDILCLQLVDMQCRMWYTSLSTCLSSDMDWWPSWAWELTICKGKRGYARPARGKRCWTPTPRGSAKAWPFGDVAPIARRRVVRHSLTTAEKLWDFPTLHWFTDTDWCAVKIGQNDITSSTLCTYGCVRSWRIHCREACNHLSSRRLGMRYCLLPKALWLKNAMLWLYLSHGLLIVTVRSQPVPK